MSTAFLVGFSRAIVTKLVEDDLLEVHDTEPVVAFVADSLGEAGAWRSLVSTLTRALCQCPDVVELYADDETLKRAIEGLPATVLRPWGQTG